MQISNLVSLILTKGKSRYFITSLQNSSGLRNGWPTFQSIHGQGSVWIEHESSIHFSLISQMCLGSSKFVICNESSMVAIILGSLSFYPRPVRGLRQNDYLILHCGGNKE